MFRTPHRLALKNFPARFGEIHFGQRGGRLTTYQGQERYQAKPAEEFFGWRAQAGRLTPFRWMRCVVPPKVFTLLTLISRAITICAI